MTEQEIEITRARLRDIVFFVTKTERAENATDAEYLADLKRWILRLANEALATSNTNSAAMSASEEP